MTAALQETRPREALPRAEAAPTNRKRVVIIGGGFAGIAAARALRRSNAEVVLIDRRNHHIFQPLLYQVATAILSPADIAAPIRQLGEKQKNLKVMLAEVTSVDLKSRLVNVADPTSGTRTIPFDFLIVAAGMQSSYFGHDEFAKYAPALKNLSDAETIRTKILRAYELAELADDERERARLMTFVLVGGGPTGVELAASMAHMATVTLRRNFRRIDPAKSSIVLIEGGNRILPTFAESLSAKAAKRLEKLGVKVLTGKIVERVDEQGVVAGGVSIPSATVLWTAGVAVSPVVKTLGSPTDRAGRIPVDPFSDGAGRERCVRRGRRGCPEPRRTSVAWRSPGCHPAGTLRGSGGFRPARGRSSAASLPIFRQRNHGGGREELRGAAARRHPNERLHDLAALGARPCHVPSPTSEPVAGSKTMVLVLLDRTARLASDLRSTALMIASE